MIIQNVLRRKSQLFDHIAPTRQLRGVGIFSVLSTQSKEDRCGLLRPDLICAARPPSPIDKELVHSALEQLSPHGSAERPERIEIWQSIDQRWLLGHAGPAPSDRQEQQPFHTPDRSVSVVLDGELGVDPSLIAHLREGGHPYTSPAQLLALLYQLHSTEMFRHLRGEFSFVLFDHQRQRLLAARDPDGTKSLYYVSREDQLVLASEMKAFWAYGLPLSWNPALLSSNALSNHCNDTFFEGVYRVPAGHYGVIDQESNHSFHFESFQIHNPQSTSSHSSRDRTVQSIRDTLRSRRCPSDATIGFYLSDRYPSSCCLQLLRDVAQRKYLGCTVGLKPHFHSYPDLSNLTLAPQFETIHLDISVDQLIASFERVVLSVESLLSDFSPAIEHMIANALDHRGVKYMLSPSFSHPHLDLLSPFLNTDHQSTPSVFQYLLSVNGERHHITRPLHSLSPSLDCQSRMDMPPILDAYLQDALRSSKNSQLVPFIHWPRVIQWLDSTPFDQQHQSIKIILTSLVILGKKFIDY